MPLPDVLIVGAGAAGVSAAYYLAQEGMHVRVLDAGEVGRGCSFGNAGLIVPGYCLPVGVPGVPLRVVRWLLDRSSPTRLRLAGQASLGRWLLHFLRACTHEKARAGAVVLHALGVASLASYRQLTEQVGGFFFRQAGWLHLFRTAGGLDAGRREARLLADLGVRSERLDSKGCLALAPQLVPELAGGILYPEEAHLEPYSFVSALTEAARSQGVEFRTRERVLRLNARGERVGSLTAESGDQEAGAYVIAAGAWSAPLLRGLLRWVPLQPAKGYSLTDPRPEAPPDLPLFFAEPHVVATPMEGALRMTGGLELVGFEPGLNSNRLASIRGAGHRYLRSGGVSASAQAWYGFRPLTPDSLPLIGHAAGYANLYFATGHGQLGLTLAPITGRLVAADLAGSAPPVDPRAVRPARYGI